MSTSRRIRRQSTRDTRRELRQLRIRAHNLERSRQEIPWRFRVLIRLLTWGYRLRVRASRLWQPN
jgi:hypothetical protein